MHLIVYGPEGSGKGTQAKLLSEHYRLPLWTSGDLVREAAQRGKSKLDRACQSALETGTYVSDEYIFTLWRKKLRENQAKSGYILDGFPRTLNQAKFLHKEISSHGYSIDKILYLKLSDEESRKRLAKRRRKLFAGSTVFHDSKDRVNRRLMQYRKEEKKLLHFFRDKYKLLE